jgi:glycosyltransferase involved in cell wall biosynthesis
MLEGLQRAAQGGQEFTLVLGGYGNLIEEMTAFVEASALRGRTRFTGKMSKPEISAQLAVSDGYLFSSDYETFSIACAEALGAGLPLVGPNIPAIAEYAGPEDWVLVTARSAEAWQEAIMAFVEKWARGGWDSVAIVRRAEAQFSSSRLREGYRAAMREIGLEPRQ